MAALGAAELGPRLELGRRDFGFPVGAPQLVVDDLDAIEPMLDVRTPGDDARGVPLADRFQVSCRRRVDAVGRSRTGEARLVVGGGDVVEQLVLRAGRVNAIVAGFAREVRVLDAAIENSAVAGVADAPVEFQLEIGELVLGDQIARVPIFRERPVDNLPTVRNGGELVPAPRVNGFAVEQRAPCHCGLWIADCGFDCGARDCGFGDCGFGDCGLRQAA